MSSGSVSCITTGLQAEFCFTLFNSTSIIKSQRITLSENFFTCLSPTCPHVSVPANSTQLHRLLLPPMGRGLTLLSLLRYLFSGSLLTGCFREAIAFASRAESYSLGWAVSVSKKFSCLEKGLGNVNMSTRRGRVQAGNAFPLLKGGNSYFQLCKQQRSQTTRVNSQITRCQL